MSGFSLSLDICIIYLETEPVHSGRDNIVDSKLRAQSSPQVRAAKAVLLRSAYERLARAKRLGSHIEAVALLETLLSDRLEVLESVMLGEVTKVDTLGRLLTKVKNFDVLPESLIEDLHEWRKSRNLAVHQLVKITHPDEADWAKRIAFIRTIALEGEVLLSELKSLVAKISREKSKNP